ncbi:MAG: cupin domain-containing protein [Deltaproteobacteria bacterium]|nr:cupin domain-containing protein [Deltaproteobacteria bacterium]
MLEPWREVQEVSDRLKRFVYQDQEDFLARSLPHVVKQLPMKPTVMGMDSPHQTGHHVCYDMLTRGPLYGMTSHFTRVAPNAPVRGVHRHIRAPALFCINGKGWEWNDGETYLFETYDLLIIPPYTMHQHGSDKEIGCTIYVPETGRMGHLLGLMYREQHKLSEKPTFPEGTEPIYGDEGKLLGYRIKKGVLGITKDIEVILGTEPNREATFQARRSARGWKAPVEDTNDRYLKLMHDEAEFCRKVDHVARDAEEPWEWTRQGKLKWMVHPDTETATNGVWIYFHEIPTGSRSGKHRHVSEELILVLEGHGYDLHDGERWDWEQGDLICVPSMTVHQHFNLGEDRALLLSSMPSFYMNLGLGGIEQLEDAPEFMQEGR